jgi:hypothetical protein
MEVGDMEEVPLAAVDESFSFTPQKSGQNGHNWGGTHLKITFMRLISDMGI